MRTTDDIKREIRDLQVCMKTIEDIGASFFGAGQVNVYLERAANSLQEAMRLMYQELGKKTFASDALYND